MKPARFLAAIAVAVALLSMAPFAVWAQEEQSLEDLFKNIPAPSGGGESAAEGANAGATPATAATAAATAQPLWNLRGTETLDYRLSVFRDSFSYSGVYLWPRLESLVTLTGGSGLLKVTSSWRATIWPAGTSAPGAISLSDPAALTIVPENNYISLGLGTLNIDAGYFIQPWGAADGLNPTDNINPVDYARSLTPESIPSFLLRLVYFPTPSIGIETVFEPVKQADLFPVSVTDRIPAALFSASEVSVSQPPTELSSAVLGGRVSFYTDAADLSLSYLYDLDQYYTPVITYAGPSNKTLTLERMRIHRFGADVKTTAGPFGLWAEACYSLTTDPSMTSSAIRNPYLSWTVGTDFNYGPSGALYLNFQYSGRYVFGYYRSFYTDYPNGQPDPIKMGTDPSYAIQYYDRALSQSLGDENEALLNTFALKADFPFADGKWKPGIACSYLLPVAYDATQATRYGSLLLEPKISFAPADPVTITLGSELIFAWKKDAGSGSITPDTTDRLGMFHDQSSVFLTVAYAW